MADSLAHSKWVRKYHIVFTPKYRRKIDYWGMREDIRDIIRDLCKWKGVAIIGMLSRPHPYAGKDSTEVFRVKFYGIPKGEKRNDDIRASRKFNLI